MCLVSTCHESDTPAPDHSEAWSYQGRLIIVWIQWTKILNALFSASQGCVAGAKGRGGGIRLLVEMETVFAIDTTLLSDSK